MSDLKYISSIINKYGDRDNVPSDCRQLYDILERQGYDLLIDCMAEFVGKSVLKYKIPENEVQVLTENLLKNLNDAIKERT